MRYKEIIHNNLNFIIVMLFVIVLGIIGITYALKIGFAKPININVNTAPLAAIIEGDTSISNIGSMIPIEDSLIDENEAGIIDGTFSDQSIVKVQFTVSNVDTNPDNTIYDIALHDIDMDCVLKTEYLKWRLYKDNELLSYGNFSPTFDITIEEENRLVLTTTQEILESTSGTYTFIMWISESCPSDMSILDCPETLSQNDYLNKNINATIKLELSTKSTKELIRIKGTELICE